MVLIKCRACNESKPTSDYLYSQKYCRFDKLCKMCRKVKVSTDCKEYTSAKRSHMFKISYKGAVYVEASAKLPISYSGDDKKAVDKLIAKFAFELISVLKPQSKPSKDFSLAFSYAFENLCDRIKSDSAMMAADQGTLPKELRK